MARFPDVHLHIARGALTLACLIVCIPGGHIALPWGIRLLRIFFPIGSELRDWIPIGLFATGAFLCTRPAHWHPVLTTLGAIALYASVIWLEHLWFADPKDLEIVFFTGVPFGLTCLWAIAAAIVHD
ncbi:MAG: hypothetical protein RLZZ116_1130 [Planctomycetota bacterium]|jgi:hypothetical protein